MGLGIALAEPIADYGADTVPRGPTTPHLGRLVMGATVSQPQVYQRHCNPKAARFIASRARSWLSLPMVQMEHMETTIMTNAAFERQMVCRLRRQADDTPGPGLNLP